jgi:hypothetical protein
VEQVQILYRTIQQSTKALYVLGFNLMLGIVIFGSLMYLAEGTTYWDKNTRSYWRHAGIAWNDTTKAWDDVKEPSPFQSIPHSFWWAIVTVMTVGYGDYVPITKIGFFVSFVANCFGLVILALPVGLIGGKFSQVWAENEVEKGREKNEKNDELFDMTSEVLRFDPSVLHRMLLIQIWNNRDADDDDPSGEGLKCHEFEFMGEAKLELKTLGDTPYSSNPIKLRLIPNPNILKRSVTGSVNIKYEWKPSSLGAFTKVAVGSSVAPQSPPGSAASICPCFQRSDEGQYGFSKDSRTEAVQGVLTVTVISAEKLINLDFARPSKVSSPFCKVLVYPVAPDKAGDILRPQIWRTPSIKNNLNPTWPDADQDASTASHDFHFDWPKHEVAREPLTKFDARSNEEKIIDVLVGMEEELKLMQAQLATLRSRVDSLPATPGPAVQVQADAATAEDSTKAAEDSEGAPPLPSAVPGS